MKFQRKKLGSQFWRELKVKQVVLWKLMDPLHATQDQQCNDNFLKQNLNPRKSKEKKGKK